MRIKTSITFLFTFAFLLCRSQHVEILRQSGFKHDYVIGDMEYVEDVKDTARLKFIATLQITDKTYYWTGIVVHWLDRFQVEAKKLGANSFCIDTYSSKDSLATLSIKVFFASIPFLKENKEKRDKNNIICFSSFTDMQKDSFYVDKVKQDIDPKRFYVLKAKPGKDYDLRVNPTIAPQHARFKNEKASSKYFIAPYRKGVILNTNINPSSMVSLSPDRYQKMTIITPTGPIGAASFVYGMLFALRGNKIVEVDYRGGRFMTDIYK